jgi:CrcB protein
MTQYRNGKAGAGPRHAASVARAVASDAARSRRSAARAAAMLYAAVAAGSVIGGLLRALASLAIDTQAGSALHLGTLFVNVTGSFVIGLYAALTGPEGRLLAGPRQRQFVMTGICGGYTTFSAFSLETLRLLQAGNVSAVGLNIGLSITGGLAAAWLGHALATRLNRLRRS